MISEQAAAHNAVLVDIRSLVDDLHANGITVGGVHLTTDYLGGLFSLDGIHPNNTGHALFANKFIETMNSQMGTGIPLVSVEKVAKDDPLIQPCKSDKN